MLNSSVDLLFSGVHSNRPCQSNGVTSGTVDFTALRAGAASNTSGSANFSSSSAGSSVQITGSASGGTDNIVTIVQQSDIDNATNKINSSDSRQCQATAGTEPRSERPTTDIRYIPCWHSKCDDEYAGGGSGKQCDGHGSDDLHHVGC